MTLQFSGDRNSLTIRIGIRLQKLLGKKLISVMLWDGYKSHISLIKENQ